MPELIDREQAGKNICKYCASNAYCKEDDCMVYQGLRDTPTIQIEAKPVRHGRWIQVDETKCRCSECETIAFIALYPNGSDKNYCPHCGCRMQDEGD